MFVFESVKQHHDISFRTRSVLELDVISILGISSETVPVSYIVAHL